MSTVQHDPEPPVRGREKFHRVRPLLMAMTAFLRVLPAAVSRFLWDWADGIPGFLGAGFRYAIAKRLAASLGENVYFGEYVQVRRWENIRIGSNVSFHRGCYLDGFGGISIADEVSIAHATSILSFEHSWADTSRPIRDNPVVASAVSIASDVWIGCGVRILAGVHIGSRTIVAAGAVVTKSSAGGEVLGGVPAHSIKMISRSGGR